MSDNLPAVVENGIEQPLLHLYIHLPVTAQLPVRWRLSQQLVNLLREREFVNPHLILTVQHGEMEWVGNRQAMRYRDTGHLIVPLDRELQYVGFRQPGTHRIQAVVVDIPDKNVTHKLARWRNEPGGNYGSIYTADGQPDPDAFEKGKTQIPYIATGVSQQVDVSPDMFATERTGWTNWLVTHFFPSGGTQDDCHFRRRLWTALLLYMLPSVTLVWIGRIIIMLFVLLFGLRNVRWGFLNPFDFEEGPRESLTGKRTSIWFQKKDGKLRALPFWILQPFTLGAALCFTQAFDGRWWLAVLYIAFPLFVASLIVYATYRVIRKLRTTSAEERNRSHHEKLLGRLDAMVGGDNVEPEVSALPFGKRLISLRFQGAKARVCKPFARW